MKKFLFIHDIEKEILDPQNTTVKNMNQNVGLCWLKCFDWKGGESECQTWQKVTPEECNHFEFVMFWLLTEPGNPDKYHKILDTIKKMKAKSIVYCDGPVGWGYQMNSLPLELKEVYLQICRFADYMFCFSQPESVSYWNAIRNGNNFSVIDRPHPVEWKLPPVQIECPWEVDYDTGEFINNNTKGPFTALPKGINNINEERNIFSSLAVAKYMQDEYNYITFLHTATPIEESNLIKKYYSLVGVNCIVEIKLKPWNLYLQDLGRASIAVHLDILETRGQFALDCAMLGIPLICSSSVAGYKLFPHTYVEYPRDIDSACELADRLLIDDKFCNYVIDYAKDKLQEYSYKNTRRKFDEAVKIGGQIDLQ
jgi:hypothetical protein